MIPYDPRKRPRIRVPVELHLVDGEALEGTVFVNPDQRACRRNLAGGKRGRAKLALVYHRPINSNFLLKMIGHVPALLGHFN